VTLAPGGVQQFSAKLRGTPLTKVKWSATGGTIDQTGKFTAGATPGTFQVRAKNSATGESATAKVVIAVACGTAFSKQLILGNHTDSKTFELDHKPGVIDQTLPSTLGFSSVSSGKVDFRSITLSADDPDTQDDVGPGGQVTGVAAVASVADAIVLNASDPALQGTQVQYDVSVRVTASIAVTGDHALGTWSVFGAVGGLNVHAAVSTIAGQSSGDPSGGTFTATLPGTLGAQSAIGFTVSVSAGVACNPAQSCPPTNFTGSAKTNVAVEVLAISNVRDLAGNPVSVSICSGSGTSWGGG
jgi:hypothetical protein